jgi:hypothetical protein
VAVPASSQAFSQVGLFLDNATNNPIILRNNTANLSFAVPIRNKLKKGGNLYYKKVSFAVPIRNKLKKGGNLYYKKAKCSLMSLMYLGMPSLCLLFIWR